MPPRAGLVLVLDIGTSALKAAMIDADGRVRASAAEIYGDDSAPDRLDPRLWWQSAVKVIAALGPCAPDAIVFSGTMENLIPVDHIHQPTGPAVLYSDPCGAPYLEKLRADLDARGAGAVLGNAPEPLMTAFKILWMADREPALLRSARWLLPSPKDYLILHMTGRAVTDPTTASTTGLMDIAARQWSAELVDALGIDAAILPEIIAADAEVGRLRGESAVALGLPEGVPVINGCGDVGATTLGSMCRDAGDVSIQLGTTGWVARVTGEDKLHQPLSCYRLAHPLTGRIIEVLPLLSAGGCAAWARARFGLSLDEAEAAATKSDADPHDLLFLPYLNGERSPFLDLDVRGAFLGLAAEHGAGDMYRAVLEGVAFAVAANLDVLCDSGRPADVHVSGGGATSAVWRAVIADALDLPVHVPAAPTFVTAAGAAALARGSPGTLAQFDDNDFRTQPRPDRAARTARLRQAFDRGTQFARDIASELSGG